MVPWPTPCRFLALLALWTCSAHARKLHAPARSTAGLIGIAATHNQTKEALMSPDVSPVHRATANASSSVVSVLTMRMADLFNGMSLRRVKPNANTSGSVDGGKKADAKTVADALTMLMAGCSVLFVLLFVLLLLFVLFVRYILGHIVKTEIESMDREMIGTDIEVGSFSMSLLFGRISLRDVRVLNPLKSGYLLPYLLTVDSIEIRMCVPTLLWSLGCSVILKSLVVNNVHVNVEKHSVWTSNVKEISDFLYSGDDDEDTETIAHDEETGGAKDDPKAEKSWLNIRALKMQQLSVTLQNEVFGKALTSSRLEMADIVYDNFDKESGGKKGTKKITAFLLKSLLKNVRSAVGF